MILNLRYGWLGMFTLPTAAISIMLPVVFLPFVYVMTVMTIQSNNEAMLVTYAAIFLAVQSVQAVAGVALSRENPRHLLIVPLYRLIAEPLRAYLLYKSAFTALRGTRSRWNKVARTGTAQILATTGAEVQR
jgi:biofilm PGA synthesis N-glycosyltransferase PgaC